MFADIKFIGGMETSVFSFHRLQITHRSDEKVVITFSGVDDEQVYAHTIAEVEVKSGNKCMLKVTMRGGAMDVSHGNVEELLLDQDAVRVNPNGAKPFDIPYKIINAIIFEPEDYTS